MSWYTREFYRDLDSWNCFHKQGGFLVWVRYGGYVVSVRGRILPPSCRVPTRRPGTGGAKISDYMMYMYPIWSKFLLIRFCYGVLQKFTDVYVAHGYG